MLFKTVSKIKSGPMDQLQAVAFFGLLSFIAISIAYSKGFFTLHSVRPPLSVYLRQIIIAFALYLGTMILLTPLIAKFMMTISTFSSSELMGLTQFVSVLLALLLLFIYSCMENKETVKAIWKDPSQKNSSWIKDLGFGALVWFISFPIVATIGEICDFIIYTVFGVEWYEQVAVRYLKTSLESPLSLFLALFTIVFLAPIIEEYLFRGCLQNWLKKHLGFKAAIPLSAVFFACFHLAPSQGAGNISLFFSLLAFACFLGFVYERQKSLFASIGLHMTFNLISAFRLIFAQDI
jgi:hypothetical protein